MQDSLTARLDEQGIEEFETIHFGFEVIAEQGVETRHFGIHHHNGHRDALLAQLGTLIGTATAR